MLAVQSLLPLHPNDVPPPEDVTHIFHKGRKGRLLGIDVMNQRAGADGAAGTILDREGEGGWEGECRNEIKRHLEQKHSRNQRVKKSMGKLRKFVFDGK